MAFVLILSFIAVIVFGPRGPTYVPHHPLLLKVENIESMMFKYANDHNGAYPTGHSSTEVFQKLIDEKYCADSTVFWAEGLNVPGKSKPITNKLEPENVCWDITVPLDANALGFLPVVFSTGYRINYVPGGNAVPLFMAPNTDIVGIWVAFHGGEKGLKRAAPDGTVTNLISSNFNPAGEKYQQLTPDGPLSP
jgi:hypothetical protein